MKYFFLISTFTLLLISCNTKPPVPEETLILIYTDLMFAQDTAQVSTKNIDSLRAEVFNRYFVSENDYLNTIEFYNEYPERWEKFFERVIEYVESLKSKPVSSNEQNISFWPRLYVKVQN